MKKNWQELEIEILKWDEVRVNEYLQAGGHNPTGTLEDKKAFILDIEFASYHASI